MLIDIHEDDSAAVKAFKAVGSIVAWLFVIIAAFVSALLNLAKKS